MIADDQPPVPPSSGSSLPEVLLYTRAGCHLCDEAKRLILELQARSRFAYREVDIDQDDALRQKYNDEVPVVFINGKKAFKYRIDARGFLSRLERGRERE